MYSLYVPNPRLFLERCCRHALMEDAAPVRVRYENAASPDLFEDTSEELRADRLTFPEDGEFDRTADFLKRLNPRMAEALNAAARSERRIVAESCGYALRVKLWGNRAAEDWGASDARAILEAERTVRREVHRFLGILRFRNEAGIWVAKCAPDFDIVDLLEPHFANRMEKEPFAIVDERRGKKVGRDDGRASPSLAETDNPYSNEISETLWQRFFTAHENPERLNPKAQDAHIPRRYRSYLPEFGD